MRFTWKILLSKTAQKINLKKMILMTKSETCSPPKFHPVQPFLLACFFFEDEKGSVGKDHKDKRDRKECREHVMIWYGKI